MVGINLAPSQTGPQLTVEQFPQTLTATDKPWAVISAEARTSPGATVQLVDATASPQQCYINQWPLPNWRRHVNRSVFWVSSQAGCQYSMTFTATDKKGVTTKSVTTTVLEPK